MSASVSCSGQRPAPGAALPEVHYTPESPIRHPGRLVASMLRDLAASRELTWRLFVRDLTSQYRQSVLGYFWAFVPPLLAALPWVLLERQNIVTVQSTGMPYPAFVITGTILWQTFIEALNAPLRRTQGARTMLAKINFPREALLMAGVAESIWNLLIRLLLLVPVLLLVVKVPPSVSMLWAPVGIAGLMLLGTAAGLLLTPAGMLYTDVSRGIGFIATFGMLLTPVLYPPPTGGVLGVIAAWNPVTPLIVTARDWLTGQPATMVPEFWMVTAASAVLFFVAWFFYRLTMPILIERLGG